MKKYETFEEWESYYLLLLKQEYALEDDRSYFDVTTSNVDGTIFGEMFDNAIRIKLAETHYPEFFSTINKEEYLTKARDLYEQDLAKQQKETQDE